MAVCLCLVCNVHKESHERRNISSKSSEPIKVVMEELLCTLMDKTLAETFLRSCDFLCRKCFGVFEKLLKLRKDIIELEMKLKTTLEDCYSKKHSPKRAEHFVSPPSKRIRELCKCK